MDYGTVLQVVTRDAGDVLSGDHAAGATTLYLTSTSDFSATGGTLQIEGTTYTYLSSNPDTATVQLDPTTPLAASYLDDAAIEVTPLPIVTEKLALFIRDDLGADGEWALVPHNLFDKVPDGIRDPEEQEQITVEWSESNAQWEVRDILGKAPVVDGTYIDPSTLPDTAAPDGLAPPQVGALTLLPGIRAIIAQWPAVSNPDEVKYNVYASLASGFTKDSTTLVGTSISNQFSVRKAYDNNTGGLVDLVGGQTVYVAVSAEDVDGNGPASAEASAITAVITSADIAANSVTADMLVSNSVTADKLAAVVGLLGSLMVGDGSGRTITMSSEVGIQVKDQQGNVILSVPTTLLQDISVTADMVARSLTALGVVAMRNPINELAPGANLFARKGTTASRTPLVVSFSYPHDNNAPLWGDQNAWTFDADGDPVYVQRSDVQGAEGGGQSNVAGGYDAWRGTTSPEQGDVPTMVKNLPGLTGHVVNGLLRIDDSATAAGTPKWAVVGLHGTNWRQLIWFYDANWDYIKYVYLPDVKANPNLSQSWVVTTWGTGSVALLNTDANAKLVCYLTTWSATASGGTLTASLQWTSAIDLGVALGPNLIHAALFGIFDSSGNFRHIVWAQTDTQTKPYAYVVDVNGVRQVTEEFPLAAGHGTLQNAAFDPWRSHFYTSDTGGQWWLYSNNVWSDPNQNTLWASQTWETNEGLSTTEGPVLKITPIRRAWMSFTAPPLPTGVDRWRLFLGKGPSDPGRLGRQDQGVTTAETIELEYPVWMGPNPTDVSTMLDSTPATFLSDGQDAGGAALVKLSGDGTYRLGPIVGDVAGKSNVRQQLASTSVATANGVGNGVETLRLVTSFVARTGQRYNLRAVCNPRIDTAAGYTTARLKWDTSGSGVTGTLVQTRQKDHRAANRAEGVDFEGEFTYNGPDNTTIYAKLTMTGGGGITTDDGTVGPTRLFVDAT